MVTILFAVVSILVFRFRSRAALELKLVALQHQLAVLSRQRPGRPQLSSLDRLLWVLLYRIWPQVIEELHAFAHDTSRPSALRRTSPKCLSFPRIISARIYDAGRTRLVW